MSYLYLDSDVEIEKDDEVFDKNFDRWMKCEDYGNGQRTLYSGKYRRPITGSAEYSYTAPGVVISIDPNLTGAKEAAAFIGAIAMLLDGQNIS